MKKQISLWLKIGSVAALLFLCGISVVGAEDREMPKAQKTDAPPEQKELVVYSEVTGEISAVNRHGIAVEYSHSKEGSSSEEVYLPIEGNVEVRMLGRIMTVNELKPGDIVNVRYAKIYQVAEDGKQTHIKTLAKSITVLTPAPLESPLSSRGGESS